MDKLGIRIKEARTNAGVTQKELAEHLGMKQSNVSDYERGISEPSAENLIIIADICKISLDVLLRGAEKVPVGIPIMGGDTKIPEASFVYVPAYNIAAAAGYGAFNSDERIEKYIAFREDWVRVNLMSSPKNLFVIRAIGDSMKPAIEPGDMLLCDRGRTNYGEEGIFIIRLEGTLLVKNIQKLPQYRVKLWSTNTEYQPIEIDIKTITDFEVLAQVIWIAKSLV